MHFLSLPLRSGYFQVTNDTRDVTFLTGKYPARSIKESAYKLTIVLERKL